MNKYMVNLFIEFTPDDLCPEFIALCIEIRLDKRPSLYYRLANEQLAFLLSSSWRLPGVD
jgi:hypothetical protein